MVDGRRVLIALTVAIALGALGFGLAIAQDSSDDDGAAEETDTEGEVAARRRAQLTPAQQQAEVAAIGERGTQTSRRVLGMLDEARRERDIIRVTCLNDKLTQINAHLRTLGQRTINLETALAAADAARRNHEFTVITILGQHFRTLAQEANACIGQDIFETGTTRVVTDVDPETPEEDLVVRDPIPPEIPFIPPPASGET